MKAMFVKGPAKIVGLLLFLNIVSCTKKHPIAEDTTVLQVLGYKLSASEFSHQLVHKLKDYDSLAVKDPEVIAKSQEAIVNEFMTNAIIRNWAKENKIFVRKEQLDLEVSKVTKSYPDKLSFRRALAESQQSLDWWRDQLAFSLLEKMVYESIKTNIEAPSEKEIKDYYNKKRRLFSTPAKVKLQQIVTDSEPNAEKILLELKRGKDLGELAKKYSLTSEAEPNGVTGWIESGALPVFDAAFTMTKGQRSAIKKSPFGYHIYVLLDKKNPAQLTFAEAKDEIIAAIIEQRQETFFASWLESEIKKVSVLKNDGFFSNIKVETTAQ